MIGRELALVEQNIEQSDEKQDMWIDNQGQTENVARALKTMLLKDEKLDKDNKAVHEFVDRGLFVKPSKSG